MLKHLRFTTIFFTSLKIKLVIGQKVVNKSSSYNQISNVSSFFILFTTDWGNKTMCYQIKWIDHILISFLYNSYHLVFKRFMISDELKHHGKRKAVKCH